MLAPNLKFTKYMLRIKKLFSKFKNCNWSLKVETRVLKKILVFDQLKFKIEMFVKNWTKYKAKIYLQKFFINIQPQEFVPNNHLKCHFQPHFSHYKLFFRKECKQMKSFIESLSHVIYYIHKWYIQFNSYCGSAVRQTN